MLYISETYSEIFFMMSASILFSIVSEVVSLSNLARSSPRIDAYNHCSSRRRLPDFIPNTQSSSHEYTSVGRLLKDLGQGIKRLDSMFFHIIFISSIDANIEIGTYASRKRQSSHLTLILIFLFEKSHISSRPSIKIMPMHAKVRGILQYAEFRFFE